MIFMRAMRARNHGIMGSGGRGRGEAENREILIRAKVDFMFNRRGERKFLGASGKKHWIFWDSEKSWGQRQGGGPSWPPKAARKNHQWLGIRALLLPPSEFLLLFSATGIEAVPPREMA